MKAAYVLDLFLGVLEDLRKIEFGTTKDSAVYTEGWIDALNTAEKCIKSRAKTSLKDILKDEKILPNE